MAEFDTDVVMRRRCSKHMSLIPEPNLEGRWPRWPQKVAFRLQAGLENVRRNLVVQLLAVCCQIYNEAAAYFWTSNTWRFSDDRNWEFLWRFLFTIGANARSMIQNLEVPAPNAYAREPCLPVMTYWDVKNHPKLRMAKLPFSYGDWHDVVWHLWIRERSLRKLRLIIPSSSVVLSPYNSLCSWDYGTNLMHFPAKTQVIVEHGGFLSDPADVLQYGWDVVALPGSRVPGEPLAKPEVVGGLSHGYQDHLRVWASDLDYLVGVMQLFDIEEVSVHANGGKAKPRRSEWRVYRLLRAFGPCVIVIDDVPCDCWRCRSPYSCNIRNHGPIDFRYRSLLDTL